MVEETGIKLNIGAGKSEIDGYTPIDRMFGSEAYPLEYADGTVDEIRASHVLEHFDFGELPKVLDEWVRVLKPGGRIRIAVPDFDKIVKCSNDPTNYIWPKYLMGGQSDPNDYHKAVFNRQILTEFMANSGIENIDTWESEITDCAALPVSLNLAGTKTLNGKATSKKTGKARLAAIMSVPRVGWMDAAHYIYGSLLSRGIPLDICTGVFWGQCMERLVELKIEQGVDWLMTVDYDSMFRARHVDMMVDAIAQNPEIDAICALQCRRGDNETPLCTLKGVENQQVDGTPTRVDTGHFGMTIIRLNKLKNIPRPWFKPVPGEDGRWNEGKMDDDIWFWHQWKEAGNSLYMHTGCRIGHLQLMVSEFGDDYQPRHVHVKQWRESGEGAISA